MNVLVSNGRIRSFREIICRKMFPAEAKAKAEKMIKNISLLLKIESITLFDVTRDKKVQLKNYTCQN
jgi:hypothetical protein